MYGWQAGGTHPTVKNALNVAANTVRVYFGLTNFKKFPNFLKTYQLNTLE